MAGTVQFCGIEITSEHDLDLQREGVLFVEDALEGGVNIQFTALRDGVEITFEDAKTGEKVTQRLAEGRSFQSEFLLQAGSTVLHVNGQPLTLIAGQEVGC